MSKDDFAAVTTAVRERVVPTDEERRALRDTATALTERIRAAVADLPVDAAVIQVGSTARDTWLAGDRDIDLFVAFPPDLDREQLAEYGLKVGHAVLPDGHEEYAEHPYVVGSYNGYDVDLVPCFDVEDATAIQSAVDRTPFHTRYLEGRLDGGLADEARVAKQFCKAIGVYGSDLRTRGFSGFLLELLVCEYGGFRPLVGAAADWQPPVEFDPGGHAAVSVDDPLVVVDPTDPERNVAAVCSPANVARLQHYARELLADPRADLFEPDTPAPLDTVTAREHVAARGTTPLAVRFDAPEIVEDQLWPQLEKSLAGVADELDRRGFGVLRTVALATDTGADAALLLELTVAELPAVERHEGPPVHVREHAGSFFDAYADTDAYGPFVDGDRYVVERERAVTSAAAFCESDRLFDVALGTHVESALREGYEVLVDEAVADLADPFGAALARYFAPRP
ncbi:MAG: tRNA nucleotidyltransferase (CCA-adding enzyme) [Natronomonas sp.]|jgi:tRNA nucleotidyltransferase (CCA-adding enzyme)